MLAAIQKDLTKNSPYWEFAKTPNNDDSWDVSLSGEAYLLEQFGQMIKDVVISNGASLSMRMEI